MPQEPTNVLRLCRGRSHQCQPFVIFERFLHFQIVPRQKLNELNPVNLFYASLKLGIEMIHFRVRVMFFQILPTELSF